MEEEKAAAYYDELTRKGAAAARFKQGLGFSYSSSAGDGNRSDAIPARRSAIPSSSSFLSSFVKASGPSNSSDVAQKQVQIESIQSKLKKKPSSSSSPRASDRSDRDYRDRDRDRGRRERSRSVLPRRYRSSEKKRDDDYDDRKSKTE